jgi:murein DD-endopeptidase MepM/ murein hydrolase activator NlpD
MPASSAAPDAACPPLVVLQGPQSTTPERHRRARRAAKRRAPRAHTPPAAARPAPPAVPVLPRVPAPHPPARLLPVYRAAAARYGVRWEVLAAINAVETDFGRAMAVSSAGAVGWMQFMPATWAVYGVDADADGRLDPEDPVDAIFAAARYLAAAGAATDLPGALFAYNHADWYVTAVLARARAIAEAHAPLADALAAVGAGQFPVAGPTRWRRSDAAVHHGAISLYARRGAPVVAVTAARVIELGRSRRIGRYVVLRDDRGTRFTYAGLATLATERPVLHGPVPAAWPRAGRAAAVARRLFAHPRRPRAQRAGGFEQLLADDVAVHGYAAVRGRLGGPVPSRGPGIRLEALRRGARVPAGAILGRVGRLRRDQPAHVRFAVRPRGRRVARLDPRPLLEGWRRLEVAGGLRAGHGLAVAEPAVAAAAWPGQPLAEVVLADPRITIYPCGREDIAAGRIDDRVLAVLELLADSGLSPTVSSLQCGHSRFTTRGTISEHAGGDAVDIAAVDGIPILGHQGPDTITERTILRLLELHGELAPHQIISLMRFADRPQTLALPDHDDHIHVGFRPRAEASRRTT